jgi:ribosomal protein S18 acetylase RimI-like enzyme
LRRGARRAAEAPTGAPEGQLAVDWVIEPIAEAHIAGFRAALDRVARERRYLALLEAPPLERTAEFVRGNIAGGNPQYVAIGGDAVVGWCDVTPMERAVFAHRGVLGMGVVPEYRGRGVGRALVEATLSAARSKGLARIDLEVRADNAAAIGLYRAVGFKVEGVKRDALRLDDGRFDLVVMALHLDGGG